MPLAAVSCPGIKVLQVNLNHCWTAQQLLLQTIVELNIDVVIVSDYNRPLGQAPRWVPSSDGKCAVYVSGRSADVSDQGYGCGFALAKVGGKLFFSCYYTPNCTIQDFDRFLNSLELSVQHNAGAGSDVIVAGDFNSHSAEWGSSKEDARGSLLSNFASALDLTVCNVGSVPTFRRVNATSVIDVTFARSADKRPLVHDWSVLEQRYSGSDHEYIAYSVFKSESRSPTSARWVFGKETIFRSHHGALESCRSTPHHFAGRPYGGTCRAPPEISGTGL